MLQSWFASIPSPSHNVVHLGPLPLHMYGICVALGVLVAVKIADVRWVKRGYPKGEVGEIAVWLVLAGAVGARVYHLFTGYNWHTGGIAGAFEVWKGGLSIWGAIIGGLIAAMVIARKRHMDKLALMDAVAPGLLAAQAIGRWGNYFNQEIFGGPTKLPWGLEIDIAHRPIGYERFATFHPTFLYESLYCLLVLALLLVLEHLFRLRRADVRRIRHALLLRPDLLREHADRQGVTAVRPAIQRAVERGALLARRGLVHLARSPRGGRVPRPSSE